ncbi:Fanconi anemia core complex-associated protein 100 [Nematolebias whitei]|uniref:Fanconi anemia core complex-associated protein 100 n=1 Tax=Nematolebias whitei TaxID=451745 RepID=UPI00189849B3|nr:Fanconi anemia core complex-associated protein 100 [Nematolebias whitei]
MEGRCSVETWAEFGLLGKPGTKKVTSGFETNIFICTGCDEVYVFSATDRKLTAVLHFPGPVNDLVESHDKQLLFVACRCGVYCVDLQLLLHRVQGSSGDASSSPAELNISSEFVAVDAGGVSSLLLVGSVLLTLCQTDTSWLMTLYKRPQQTQPTTYEVLGLFHLPLVSPAVHGGAKVKAGQTGRTVLLCAHFGIRPPLSTSPDATDVSYSHVCLEPVLFKLLFGVEAALAKSPVVLCGLPDGRLCFLPLGLPGSRLRVLYSLEQPVVFAGASVVTETDPGHAQCLVVVGEQGRVALIKADKAGPEREGSFARFTEGCVSGPVECGFVGKNCLYYSTGSDLLALKLSDESAGREDRERDVEALQSPTSLNVCGVIALSEPTFSAAGEVQLLGLTVRGQLQSIRSPVRRRDEGFSQPPSSQAGRSVRDLLSAIGDVCERASALKAAIKSKNQTLRQLSRAVNISFLLTGRTTTTEEPFPVNGTPIRCHAATSWSRSLQKDAFSLKCVLNNSSPHVLERGWALSVAVFPASCSSSAGQETSTSFVFPFYNLCPGETLEVSLPVAAAGDTTFPLTVNCSLILSLSSFLGEEEEVLRPGLQNSCFSLALNTLTVDWLHASQVISPTAPQPNNAADALQAFLRSRLIRCSKGGGASKPEKYSASVRVSSELLRDTLTLKSFGLDTEVASQSLCSALLRWLLFEDHEGVKMGHGGDEVDTSGSVIQVRAPNEAAVKLSAKEMKVEEEEEGLVCVEVQIESSSVAPVCGLHHAVLRRIQTLLKKASEKAASTEAVQRLGLRRALQQAEIQQSQISEALSVGMSSSQMKRFLLDVYQALRENPLLVI